MDEEASSSSSAAAAPRKPLRRSASWSGRPPKPLSISRTLPITAWPLPASDDSAHPPPTPSSDCSRVADHLYLGSEAAARDRATLRRHGITHILNCVGAACPDLFRGDLIYKTLWLHDSPAEDIASVFYDAFDYLEEVRSACPPARVLVHCRRGASRSAALVIAYLMWRHAQTFDDALRAVRAARAAADPNLGFASQLLQCQARVLLPPSCVRAYRMAPHSECDPLHLVPKSVACPARLDSRGAFLVHAPAAVFVWVGRGCEAAMEEAAAAAARQVVRYENARGPIVMVEEGVEPEGFWWGEGVCEDGEVGRRRVGVYDVDFEIFGRAAAAAMKGGDEEDGEESSPSPTPPSSFSIETGSSSSSSSAAFSPASTCSSEGCNSSPSVSPVLNLASKLPPLHPRKGKEKEREGFVTVSSRTPVASEVEKFEKRMECDSVRLGTTEVEEDVSTSDCGFLRRPLLFQWPGMDRVEEICCGALDSSSVFMLLAPNCGSGRRRSKTNVLYVWLGRNSSSVELGGFSESSEEGGDSNADWDKITADFLDQVGLPVCITVQIVKEGEEPEQFLNHLFSFDQRIGRRHESGE